MCETIHTRYGRCDEYGGTILKFVVTSHFHFLMVVGCK